jgi:flagellar hook-associated protein 2
VASISSPGIGSGLDVNSIVSKLVELERRPIQLLEREGSRIQTRLSAFGQLQSAASTLRDAAGRLGQTPAWTPTVASSSDPAAVSVTPGNGAIPGVYAIQVGALAAAQNVVAAARPSASSVVGSGMLRIELGSWDAGNTVLTPRPAPPAPAPGEPPAAPVATDIPILATDTLAQIRDKINAANVGVSATIITDTSGARLVMRSTTTGLENGFRTVVTADPPPDGAPGLGMLAYDAGGVPGGMTRTAVAANAVARINGLLVETPTNTLNNTVDGLTIRLARVTAPITEVRHPTTAATPTAPIDLTVAPDVETMKKSMQEFVDAYNGLAKMLGELTKFDPATKAGGPLQGDSAATGVQRQLRSLVGSTSSASAVFARLSDVGIEVQRDGTLGINSARQERALGNLTELRRAFTTTNADPALSGFGQRLRAFADAIIGTDGSLASRQRGLQDQLQRNQRRQGDLEDRVALTEQRIRRQYEALDTQLARLSGLENYVTQQVRMLTRDNSGG